MKLRFFLMAGALVLACGQVAAAPLPVEIDRPPVDGTFRIGATGIFCVRAPCPWRGIMQIGADGHPEGRPLWAGKDPPMVKADPETQGRIDASWRESGCLLVRGRFEKGALAVHEIIGDCR